jgi:hypothetical protein
MIQNFRDNVIKIDEKTKGEKRRQADMRHALSIKPQNKSRNRPNHTVNFNTEPDFRGEQKE